jgi:glycosyltransferase involved in cell wall biosynthesis
VEVVVAANGCRDDTADRARARAPAFAAKGWRLIVLDIPEGGKPGALNRADAAASGDLRAYLDADVICAPDLMRQLTEALAGEAPRYASGRLEVAPARSWTTRRYAEIWRRLPFMRDGVPGAGLFAVNAAGRARWGDFPAIISDDTFVRVHFAPEERVRVDASYRWPMVEGWRNLVRVRRRQNVGVAEVAAGWPELMANEGKARLGARGALRLLRAAPVGVLVYGAVNLATRLDSGAPRWARGR